MPLQINEIFYSIQGESSYGGYPCVFIRLTGCNLRCSYCDTQYAYFEGEQLEIDDILKRIKLYQCKLVEITGGEPLLQQKTPQLITQLLEKRYKVLLETNGSQDIRQVDPRCVRIIDIKCPSSGEADQNKLDNLNHLTQEDEIKFVIGNRQDYEFAKNIIPLTELDKKPLRFIHFSPVFGRLEPRTLAQWLLEDHLPVRLHLQLHKIIWAPEQRGV